MGQNFCLFLFLRQSLCISMLHLEMCGFNNVEFYYCWNYCEGLFVVLNSGFGHKIENIE